MGAGEKKENTMEVWRKSSFSAAGNCVEVAWGDGDGVVVIRESDRPNEQIRTSVANFAALVAAVKAEEFDEFTRVPVAATA